MVFSHISTFVFCQVSSRICPNSARGTLPLCEPRTPLSAHWLTPEPLTASHFACCQHLSCRKGCIRWFCGLASSPSARAFDFMCRFVSTALVYIRTRGSVSVRMSCDVLLLGRINSRSRISKTARRRALLAKQRQLSRNCDMNGPEC